MERLGAKLLMGAVWGDGVGGGVARDERIPPRGGIWGGGRRGAQNRVGGEKWLGKRERE